MIITVVNNKGGVGKSTTATLLAEFAAQVGMKVGGCDLCPQQNLIDNLTLNGEPLYDEIAPMPSPSKTPSKGMLATFDVVIVDTPPNVNSAAVRNMIDDSDVIVIPMRPEKHAVYGLQEMLKLVPECSRCVVLCWIPRDLGSYEKEFLQILRDRLSDYLVELPMLKRVPRNLGLHKLWSYGLRKDEKETYGKVFSRILGIEEHE